MQNDKPQSPVDMTADVICKTVKQALIDMVAGAETKMAAAEAAKNNALAEHGEDSDEYERACVRLQFAVTDWIAAKEQLATWLS